LAIALGKGPRRRDFKAVPMITMTQADGNGIRGRRSNAILAYQGGGPKQAFRVPEIDGPWLNLMRNSMNAQDVPRGSTGLLAACPGHPASPHLALYDATSGTYNSPKLTQGKFAARIPWRKLWFPQPLPATH
jgi:hypothetical protein